MEASKHLSEEGILFELKKITTLAIVKNYSVHWGTKERKRDLTLTSQGKHQGGDMLAIEIGWLSIPGKGVPSTEADCLENVKHVGATGSFPLWLYHLPCGEDGTRWYQRGDEC